MLSLLPALGAGFDLVAVEPVRPDRVGLSALDCVVDARGDPVALGATGANLLLLVAAEDLELLASGPTGDPAPPQLRFLEGLAGRVPISIVVFSAHPSQSDVQEFPTDATASLADRYLARQLGGAPLYYECPDALRRRLATKRPGPVPGLFLYVEAEPRYRLLGFPLRVSVPPAALRIIQDDLTRLLSGRPPVAAPLPLSELGFDMDTAFSGLPEGRLLILPLTGMEADPDLPDPGPQAARAGPGELDPWLKRVAALNRRFLDAATPALAKFGLAGVGVVGPSSAEAGLLDIQLGRLEARWPGWHFIVLPKTAETAVRYWELGPVLTDSEHRVRMGFFYATRPGATPADTAAALEHLLTELYPR